MTHSSTRLGRIRRREAMALMAGAALVPRALVAQAQRRRRVAIINSSSPIELMMENGSPYYAAFHSELRRLGYTENRNLTIERWSGDGRAERTEQALTGVVASQPDAIFAQGSFLAVQLRELTKTIPIVYIGTDPIASGLVTSLARPGGNVTGMSQDGGVEIRGKQLQLLHETAPGARRVARLVPRRSLSTPGARVTEEASVKLGLTLVQIVVEEPYDEPAFRRAFAVMAGEGIQAIFVAASPATRAGCV